MIELNCTYEESKKILELGYNFAPVCTKFELYEADGLEAEKRYTKKIVYGEKVSEETVRSQYTLMGDEPWFQSKAWVQDFTPIIPKAALEACLPESIWSYPQGSHLDIANGRIGYVLNGKQIPFVRFDSGYEAFLWCHEKAQKELRKKFEEVMR